MTDDTKSPDLLEEGPAWRAAREAGHDMDLLEENLRLTPEERFRLHNIALRRIEILEAAMKEAKLDLRMAEELRALKARTLGFGRSRVAWTSTAPGPG